MKNSAHEWLHRGTVIAIVALSLLPIDFVSSVRSILVGDGWQARGVLLAIAGLLAVVFRNARPVLVRGAHFFWAVVLVGGAARSIAGEQIFAVEPSRDVEIAAAILLLAWAGYEMLGWKVANRRDRESTRRDV